MNTKLNERRIRAKERLEAQLKKGKKVAKIDGVDTTTQLTESDVKRIAKEIDILKAKIVNLS